MKLLASSVLFIAGLALIISAINNSNNNNNKAL